MKSVQISQPKLLKKEVSEAAKTLRSSKLAQGEIVEKFELALAKYCNTKHAIAVNSGTAALHSILMSLNLQPDDEVITSPFTFISTANTIIASGGKIKFCDINLDNNTLDTSLLNKVISPKTRAIINVDLYGHPASYQFNHPKGVMIISDGCQAIGAEINGKRVGSLADATAFSFYATKNITSGEGGAITTNSDDLAMYVRSFINHGQTPNQRYQYQFYGLNYRMTNISASILIPQLERIDHINKLRTNNANLYSQLLSNCPGIIIPKSDTGVKHSWHQYTIRIDNNYPLTREELIKKLNSYAIFPGVYYPKPLYLAPHLRKFVNNNDIFPNTEIACSQVLSLPVHPHVRQKEIEKISKIIISQK